jgi:hypothetical protein
MESSIVETELTDGSMTYSVQFIDGSARVVIECVDAAAAYLLQIALSTHALDASVY